MQPEQVVVYIAHGADIPAERLGRERYVAVPRGMVSQRALPYSGITSDCLLLLDDDVELAPDTAERMLAAMADNGADCVAADTFMNHRMSVREKAKAAAVALAWPSRSASCAFRVRRSGAFSYISAPPSGACLPSDTAAGPAALWRRQALLDMRLSDELWLEQDGFAYGDDMVEFYKLRVNGRRLFVLFDSGAVHLDSGSSSATFRRDMSRRMYVRAKNSFIIWWRCLHTPSPSALSTACYGARALWDTAIAAATLRPRLLAAHLRGLRDGIRFVRSAAYRAIPPYRIR